MKISLSAQFVYAARFFAAVVALVGIVVLAGYALEYPALITALPGLKGMAPTTSVALILLALAVVVSAKEYAWLRRAAAAAAGLIGVATLASDLFLGTDVVGPWMASEVLGNLSAPGRMSKATAITIVSTVAAVWWRGSKPYRSDFFAAASLLISGSALLGYAYGVEGLYSLPLFNTIALHTATCFFLLSLASMLVEPDTGWARIVVAKGDAGGVTRRQLLFMLLPSAAGWLLVKATHIYPLEAEMAMALLVMVTVVPLVVLVLRDGRTMEALNLERLANAELQAAHLLEMRNKLAEQASEIGRQAAERAKESAALYDAQRMEAVGRLTGGIAHDFNNLLMSISGNLQLLRRRTGDQDPNLRYVQNALSATEKGAKVTGQLLSFSRIQRLSLAPISVQSVLDSAYELIANSLGPNVSVVIGARNRDAWAVSDSNQLELALINLAFNARDAMPDGGVIHIDSSIVTTRLSPGSLEATYVSVRISDNGHGMSPEVAAKATEPFFTTKERGKGTGLGLAQAYGLARQSQGDLYIRSEPGKGTTVEILLPYAMQREEPQALAAHTSAGAQRASGVRRSVLVIDDDDYVREVVVQALTDAGFDVTQAADGAAGLAHLDRIRPAAAVIDFIMPGMNGAEVARRAQLKMPGLPIVFVSGYSDTVALDGIAGAIVLRKPFDIEGLSRALDAVLH